MNSQKKSGFYYLIATAGLIVFLILWQGLSKMPHRKAVQNPGLKLSVTVAKPHITTVKSYIETVGQCTAYNRIEIVPQIEGTLTSIAKPNGGFVAAGDILFKIDDKSFKAYVQQAEAQLAKDKATYELNLSQLKRSESLRSGNFVSQQEYDTYKANVEAGQAQLMLDEANCTLKRIDLSHCYISAPFAGELSKANADPFTFITKGKPLAVLNQIQPIYVDAYLSEIYLPELLNAQKKTPEDVTVEAKLIDDATVLQKGTLVFIGNEVDKSTGTFDIRAQFENSDHAFWPGRGIDMKILYKTLHDVTLIPESAIHQGNKGPFVYTVSTQGTAEMHPVTTGQSYYGWIVVNGLDKNETVIVNGHALLAPGVSVQANTTLSIPVELQK